MSQASSLTPWIVFRLRHTCLCNLSGARNFPCKSSTLQQDIVWFVFYVARQLRVTWRKEKKPPVPHFLFALWQEALELSDPTSCSRTRWWPRLLMKQTNLQPRYFVCSCVMRNWLRLPGFQSTRPGWKSALICVQHWAALYVSIQHGILKVSNKHS